MTKLNHERPYRERDPGVVVSVPDDARPWKHVTSADKERRRRELAGEAKARGKAIRNAEYEARFGHPNPLADLF